MHRLPVKARGGRLRSTFRSTTGAASRPATPDPNNPATPSITCALHAVIWFGCTSYCCANSASVFSPLMAARATLALNASAWVRRDRLVMIAPDPRHSRRSQAETPLIDLSEFGQPSLSRSARQSPRPAHAFSCGSPARCDSRDDAASPPRQSRPGRTRGPAEPSRLPLPAGRDGDAARNRPSRSAGSSTAAALDPPASPGCGRCRSAGASECRRPGRPSAPATAPLPDPAARELMSWPSAPPGGNAEMPGRSPAHFASLGFLGAGAVLMGAHDGAVDHGILVVGVACEVLEDALPHTRLGPAAEAPMHLHAVAEALGQVAPGNTGPVAVEHRLDKQPIIRRRDADPALLPRQQVLDSVPLVIVQAIAAHRSAPK